MRALGLDLGGTNIKLALLEERRAVLARGADTLGRGRPRRRARARWSSWRSPRASRRLDRRRPAGSLRRRRAGAPPPQPVRRLGGAAVSGPLSAALGRDGAADQRRPCVRARRVAARSGPRRGRRDVHRLRHGDRRRPRARRSPTSARAARRRVRPPHGVGGRPVCECGNRGCLELYAGARAIAARRAPTTFRRGCRAAARRATSARRDALARAGGLIGLAIANVLIFLCPHRVVVGGGVAEAGDLLLDPLRALDRRAGARRAARPDRDRARRARPARRRDRRRALGRGGLSSLDEWLQPAVAHRAAPGRAPSPASASPRSSASSRAWLRSRRAARSRRRPSSSQVRRSARREVTCGLFASARAMPTRCRRRPRGGLADGSAVRRGRPRRGAHRPAADPRDPLARSAQASPARSPPP